MTMLISCPEVMNSFCNLEEYNNAGIGIYSVVTNLSRPLIGKVNVNNDTNTISLLLALTQSHMMTFSRKTQSLTAARCYHIHETLSQRRHRPKTHRPQNTDAKSCLALISSQTTIPLLMPLEASKMGQFPNSVVDCAVGFNTLQSRSTTLLNITHNPFMLCCHF